LQRAPCLLKNPNGGRFIIHDAAHQFVTAILSIYRSAGISPGCCAPFRGWSFQSIWLPEPQADRPWENAHHLSAPYRFKLQPGHFSSKSGKQSDFRGNIQCEEGHVYAFTPFSATSCSTEEGTVQPRTSVPTQPKDWLPVSLPPQTKTPSGTVTQRRLVIPRHAELPSDLKHAGHEYFALN
jgi:hypothetical protein